MCSRFLIANAYPRIPREAETHEKLSGRNSDSVPVPRFSPQRTISFADDTIGRSSYLTLLNGIVVEYAYDAASRITSIAYKQNGTTELRDLTYKYDKAESRSEVGGSFARTVSISANTVALVISRLGD